MIAAIVAAILSLLATFHGSGTPGTLTRWVDGDTAHVTVAGADMTVRLPDVDAPEYSRHKARLSPECVDKAKAAAATARAREMAPDGRLVWLNGHGTDRFGRRLATVTASGTDVGAALVAQGLARTWPDGACP